MNWNFQHSYMDLPEIFYSRVQPETVRAPEMVCFNDSLAEQLGLGKDRPKPEAFCGNGLFKEAIPIAQAYWGHQFGRLNVLGDGRALLLGEQRSPKGELFDIQLKGSGRTPYSRGGDGRAALGPMLREYLISEAMFHLGIPTSRSLAVIKTGEAVVREKVLPGAILVRVAASHIRVGTFEFAAGLRDHEVLKTFVDYVIQRHDPELVGREDRFKQFLLRVVQRQARLVAQWMGVGFIHGVMNTDNMAISGETIDYGPCAFMDEFDFSRVFSSIDSQGRYSFGNQPSMAQWNLARLAEAVLPLLNDDQDAAIAQATEAVESFSAEFQSAWRGLVRKKLGLLSEQTGDDELILGFYSLLEKYQADHTGSFVQLAHKLSGKSFRQESVFDLEAGQKWLEQWLKRISGDDREQVLKTMKSVNPVVIPRNHLVEEALLEAVEENRLDKFQKLNEVLSRPFDDSFSDPHFLQPGGEKTKNYRTFCGT